MVIALFDTLKFVKRLKEAGVPSAHAETAAEVLSKIFAVNLQGAHTGIKDLIADIRDLKADIKDLKADIKDLQKTISDFRTEFNSKLEKFETRLTIKLTFIMAALLGATATLSKFFS